jgi:putative nucleotidyltransferase with HDIG domain
MAFQAKDHGNSTIELIAVMPGITAEHATIQSLLVFSQKFDRLIFHFDKGAYLDPTALPKVLNASAQTNLKVVASLPDQFPFPRAGIPIFPTVEQAVKSFRGDEILAFVQKKMEGIPQLNSQAYELLQKLNQPDVDFSVLEKGAAQDLSLASQILKTANSTFFMRRSRVENLSSAMAYLGMDGIKQILVYNVFKGLHGYLGAQEAVMKHAQNCAHLAAFIATTAKMDVPSVGKVRLAGLLHDIGSLVLAFHYPQEYGEVRTLITTKNKRTYEAEFDVFGIDHPTVGKAVAQRWGFPDYLVQVVGDHHHLIGTSFDRLTIPILCANGFLNQSVEKIPFSPYYQKMREFLSGMAEKSSVQDFQAVLEKELKQIATDSPSP